MSHTYFSTTFHVVFSTKNRKPLISRELEERLYAYIAAIINDEFGLTRKIGGTRNHIHLLVDVRPKFSPAEVLRVIKAESSKWINKHQLIDDHFDWQIGYGIFTVSHSQIDHVFEYIKNQKQHHQQMIYEEELVSLLNKHQIKYDEHFLF